MSGEEPAESLLGHVQAGASAEESQTSVGVSLREVFQVAQKPVTVCRIGRASSRLRRRIS